MSADDPTRDMAPGDEAPPGTPGAGENICPACGGTGQLEGAACETCAGTGPMPMYLCSTPAWA